VSALAYRHQRVQRLRRLLGRRSARQEEGRFVVEGANLLEEALRARVPIEAVYLDAAWARPGPPVGLPPVAGEAPEGGPGGEAGARGPGGEVGASRPGGEAGESGGNERLKTLLDRCYDLGARVFELEPGVLARVAGTVTPQPVMAVVETPAHTLTEVGARHPQLVVVCVDVRDPGNAGTVVRSAWAAGADAVVCCEGTVDMWNPKAVRSSAGAVLHVPVVTAGPPASTLEEIGRWGLRRWATVSAGGEDYASAELTQPCALVMGNEASGLPVAELASYLDGFVTIPMAGGAESLNVGMATAVLCFEAARQRRQQPSSVGTTPASVVR
jgi:TrmH family RNA methyltransferase